MEKHELLEESRKKQNEQSRDLEEDNQLPNTDLSVWLRTCHTEVKDPLQGFLSCGKIPTWLTGSLITNGPGGVDIYGKGSCKHVFDGPGLLHKFQITNGTASYSSRFVQTKSHARNSTAKRLILNEFGTVATVDPCHTIFKRIAAVFLDPLESHLSDTANISIHPFGDEIYALAETPFAHRIHLESLQTFETVNVHEELGVINHSSHPHICGRKVYNIGQKLSLSLGPHYIIAEMDTKDYSFPANVKSKNDSKDNSQTDWSPWSSAKILATIPSRWPLSLCYMHTFSLTQSYFILVEQPLSIFLPTIPLSLIYRDKPIASCLKFYPEEDTIFHVVSRQSKNKSRMSFHAPSFFFFHTINAFEMRDDETRGTFIVIDICCYKDPSMIDCMYVDALKNGHTNPNFAKMFQGRPKRFLLKLKDFDEIKGTKMAGVESETIVDIGCETPRINELFNGKAYNYFYAISSDLDRDNPGTLIKVDVVKKNYDTWCEPNAYPSEPIFVPRPGSQREDDGLVLSTVVYGGEAVSGPNRTSLIILNATSWELLAKVDFACESAIPKCLHGWFFPDKNQSLLTNPRKKKQMLSRQHSKC